MGSCFSSLKQTANLTDGDAAKKKKTTDAAKEEKKVDSATPATNGKAAEPTKAAEETKPVSAPAAATAATTAASGPKIAIVIYSMYGHIAKLAEGVKEGVEKAGGSATIYQIPETLSQTILDKIHAPPKPELPTMTLETLVTYDAFMFGIPNRYGNFPAQWKTFWDTTGQLWAHGALAGKYAGVFVSTSSQGGGQEETVMTSLSTLTHHGINYVPFGYATAFPQLTNLAEPHGGSPWGAGTFAGADGTRAVSELEMEIGRLHGSQFYGIVKRVTF